MKVKDYDDKTYEDDVEIQSPTETQTQRAGASRTEKEYRTIILIGLRVGRIYPQVKTANRDVDSTVHGTRRRSESL